MPYYRFEEMEQISPNPHLSTGKGGIVKGTYITLRNNNKEAGTGSQLHYHPNELMVYPVLGKLNAVVGTDHRIIEQGTFVHVPPNARHSMKACEDGPVSSLYCKDNTWNLSGIAADEAPPDEAPSIEEIRAKYEAGEYPGKEKMPEASEAIVEGLNDCYYPLIEDPDAPVASTRSVKVIEGQRINFGLIDSPAGFEDGAENTAHERFYYVLSGEAESDIDGDKKTVGKGDLVHVPKGAKFKFTTKTAPTRYCYFESTPFLESRISA
jgi:quercetin dioxygenase-like cupin family protein